MQIFIPKLGPNATHKAAKPRRRDGGGRRGGGGGGGEGGRRGGEEGGEGREGVEGQLSQGPTWAKYSGKVRQVQKFGSVTQTCVSKWSKRFACEIKFGPILWGGGKFGKHLKS